MSSVRLGLRRRLLVSVIGSVAIALVVLIGVFNLVLRQRLESSANSALSSRASSELAALHIVGGRLAVPEAPDAAALDTQTWVFAGTRALEAPRTDPATTRAAELLGAGPRGSRDLPTTHTRLYSVPVVSGGQRLGAVVAELSLRPYESTAQTALVASAILGVVVLALVALAAQRLIAGALRPVSHMTKQAAAWSDTDTERRFGLGAPHDELTQLAATLDGLLDRVASSLRHEQRFSAEVSHELRTPLASLIAESQLALRHPRGAEEQRAGFELVLASAQQMSRMLDTLVSAARAELTKPRGTSDALAVANAAARDCTSLATERGIKIEVAPAPPAIRVGVDEDIAQRVLAPLIENACRYGSSRVEVGIERNGASVLFNVRDDGPGISEPELESVFEPGWRGQAAGHANPRGAGLGLALARRLARAAGGDVQAQSNGAGGRFTVLLPLG